MDKERIISEIQRTAKANGGFALGSKRFEAATGIGVNDWFGKFWSRWGDAVREAGLEPNRMTEPYDEAFILAKLVQLTRSLKRVPVSGDLRLAARGDPEFPSHTVFARLGPKAKRVSRVVAYCDANVGHDDVATLWRNVAIPERPVDTDEADSTPCAVGYVYLLKHGSRREYKIGRTTNPIRREGEVSTTAQPPHLVV